MWIIKSQDKNEILHEFGSQSRKYTVSLPHKWHWVTFNEPTELLSRKDTVTGRDVKYSRTKVQKPGQKTRCEEI